MNFFRRKKKVDAPESGDLETSPSSPAPIAEPEAKKGWFSRLIGRGNTSNADEAWELILPILNSSGNAPAVKDLFDSFDTKGSGKINLATLTKGFADLGIDLTAQQVKAFQKALDKDGDGMITYKEFNTAVTAENAVVEKAFTNAWHAVLDVALNKQIEGQSIKELFEDMDKDKNGHLSYEELAELLEVCGATLSPREMRIFMRCQISACLLFRLIPPPQLCCCPIVY